MNRRPVSADFSQRVATRFATATATYDAHSPVQRHAAARLAERIATASLPPRPRVLEIGCGTGHLTERLLRHLAGARILATDLAPTMVAACRHRLSGFPNLDYAVMDGTRPAADGEFDLICGNLVAQWFRDLPAALDGLAQRLAPGGLLAFSLLGAGSFRTWHAAHEQHGLQAGALRFPTPERCRAAFPAGELTLVGEHRIDRPDSALGFLRGLRAIGADTPAPGHRPLTAGELRRVLATLGETPEIDYELIYALWRKK